MCFPSKAFEEGGIHEAIADYEDAVFFRHPAEELARRDMHLEDTDPDDFTELTNRMDEYKRVREERHRQSDDRHLK